MKMTFCNIWIGLGTDTISGGFARSTNRTDRAFCYTLFRPLGGYLTSQKIRKYIDLIDLIEVFVFPKRKT